MRAKDNCLKKKRDFEMVFKKGKSFREGFLILKIGPNNLAENRFGIIISKKVSKRATVRNKIRRRIKALLRVITLLPAGSGRGKDAILIAAAGIEKESFWEMKKMLEKLFKKSGINHDVCTVRKFNSERNAQYIGRRTARYNTAKEKIE